MPCSVSDDGGGEAVALAAEPSGPIANRGLGRFLLGVLSGILGTILLGGWFTGRTQRSQRFGGSLGWAVKLVGWVLVGLAIFLIRPILPQSLRIGLSVAVALAAGLHLGWLNRSRSDSRSFPWLKSTVGTVCLVLATVWLTSWAICGTGIEWQPYSDQALEQAATEGQPVIIDFYADWCVPCRRLDEVTFQHSDVVRLTGEGVVMIKVDMTESGDPLKQGLVRKYDIRSLPTVVFLDSEGRERTDLRMVRFLAPAEFLTHLADLKTSASRK